MLRRYSVAAVELLTGNAPTKEVECDGYMIMGFKRGEDGKMESVAVSMHQVSSVNVAEGLYSNPDLRKCALMTADIDRMENNPIRRLIRWIRGGSHDADE